MDSATTMQTEESKPELPWAQLPWAKTIIRRLEGLFDTSTLREDCDFNLYIRDLHNLKAQECSFGAASAKFIEGKEIASKLQQYLEENQQHPQRAQQQEPYHRHNEANPVAPGTETLSQDPPTEKLKLLTRKSGDIPPIPPDNPNIIRRSRESDYTFEDFWEFCVRAQQRSKHPISRRDLARLFALSSGFEGAKKCTVDKWLHGSRMRISEFQIYAAAGLVGNWEADLHEKPVQVPPKRCRREKKRKNIGNGSDDDDSSDGDEEAPPSAAVAAAAVAAAEKAAAAAADSSSGEAPRSAASAAAPPNAASAAAPPSAASAAAGAGLEHYPYPYPLSLPAAVGRGVREEARGGGPTRPPDGARGA